MSDMPVVDDYGNDTGTPAVGTVDYEEQEAQKEADLEKELSQTKGEGEGDEAEGTAKQADAEGKPEEKVISIEEFQKTYERMARAEAEAAVLKQQQEAEKQEAQKAPEYDYADAETRLRDHIAQNEGEDAVKVLNEIRAADTARLQAELRAEIEAATRGASAEAVALTAVQKLEQKYPELDNNSAKKNPEAIAFAREQLEFYSQTMNIDEAVMKAGDIAAKMYGLGAEAKGLGDAVKERKAPPAAQPPNLRGVGSTGGLGLSVERVMGMTDKELEKVPMSELRRLRGDML